MKQTLRIIISSLILAGCSKSGSNGGSNQGANKQKLRTENIKSVEFFLNGPSVAIRPDNWVVWHKESDWSYRGTFGKCENSTEFTDDEMTAQLFSLLNETTVTTTPESDYYELGPIGAGSYYLTIKYSDIGEVNYKLLDLNKRPSKKILDTEEKLVGLFMPTIRKYEVWSNSIDGYERCR